MYIEIICLSFLSLPGMLLIGVITHGHNPIYLLNRTLVSLPKDTHLWFNSDNYRGICLCSCIAKLLEWCMMLWYKDKLATSGLQFSFKLGYSTTMCSNMVTTEVVTYYWKRHPLMFTVYMDEYLMFTVYMDEYLMFTLYMDEYLMFTIYMDEYLMFTVYMDEYFGCVSYADNMKLFCPNIKGLQQMIEICERSGEKYSVKYNAKKSMCMVYDQFVDRSVLFNYSVNIMLNGSRNI